jgi:hypothetical protein
MVPTATILCWRQTTCRLALFVSGSCHGPDGNHGGNGIGNRSIGAAAMETEAAAATMVETLAVGGGNIEAAVTVAEK